MSVFPITGLTLHLEDDLMATFLVLLNPPFSTIKEENKCCSWFCVGRVANGLNVFLNIFPSLIQLQHFLLVVPC